MCKCKHRLSLLFLSASVEKPLVLQSLDDFMHRTAMGQANRPSVQKQKGGDTDDMVAKSFAMGSGKKPMLDDDEEEEDTSYSSFMVRANETATKLAKEDEEKTSRDREIERDRERLELERELERKKEKDEEIARMREVAKQTQHSSPPSSSSSRLSPSTALSPLTRSQEQIVTNAVQLLELSKATSSKLEEGWEDIATHKVISLEVHGRELSSNWNSSRYYRRVYRCSISVYPTAMWRTSRILVYSLFNRNCELICHQFIIL